MQQSPAVIASLGLKLIPLSGVERDYRAIVLKDTYEQLEKEADEKGLRSTSKTIFILEGLPQMLLMEAYGRKYKDNDAKAKVLPFYKHILETMNHNKHITETLDALAKNYISSTRDVLLSLPEKVLRSGDEHEMRVLAKIADILVKLHESGSEITKPVIAGAHYVAGGIMKDARSQSEISGIYGISDAAVRKHFRYICEKLGYLVEHAGDKTGALDIREK